MTAHVAGVVGVEPERDVGLQGCYAGFVTRLAAFVIDLITALALFAIGARIGEYILTALSGHQVQLSSAPIVADILLIAWWIFYSAYPLAQAGRTVGMAVVGLRVVHADGSDIDPGHAFLRVLIFWPCLILFGWVPVLFRRDRRALHDLGAGSAAVYAWDARAARLRFLAKRGTE
jgi:uncharacterized RDD family membrane protein YckC